MSEKSADDLRRLAVKVDNLWTATVRSTHATQAVLKALDAYVDRNNPCPELDALRHTLRWAQEDLSKVANLMSGGLAGGD